MYLNYGQKKFIVCYNSTTIAYMGMLLFILIYMDYMYFLGKFEVCVLYVFLVIFEVLKLYKIRNRYYKFIKDVHNKRTGTKEMFSNVKLVILMFAVYYYICLMFGAQITAEIEQTSMFALLLTVLTIIPLCLNFESEKTKELLSDIIFFPTDKLIFMFVINVQLTLMGAWLGAVAIPLDWDRPWQAWPIPCSIGALIGYTMGNIINLVYYNTKH